MDIEFDVSTITMRVPRAKIPALIAALSTRLMEPEPQAAAPEATVANVMLTAEQVAARLNISVKSVYRLLTKQPFARKIGGSWRFGEQGFERWLARQKA